MPKSGIQQRIHSIASWWEARQSRGFSLRTLGPNEARVLFDAAIAGVCAALALLFLGWTGLYGPGTIWLAVCPALVPACNAAFGVYGRLRCAPSRQKALALILAVSSAVVLLFFAGAPVTSAVLWGLLVSGPLVLSRLLLNLPNSRNREWAAVSVNVRGPVVVLGGAGYIGNHTVELLLNGGKSVRVLDRLMYGQDSIARFRSHPRFELIEGDVTDVRKLTRAMQGSSAVIHLAGLVGDPACAVDSDLTRHTNIVATRMAKDVAQGMGVHRFVFASSCSVYGTSDTPVDESAELRPVSLYAQTKIDSEHELLLSGRDDFYVTILRFATVFGYSARPRFDLVANLFTAQALIDGVITVTGSQQWRPFVHVRDLARAIVMTLDADPQLVQSQIYNVGDARLNLTILQLAEIVRDVVQPIRPVEIRVNDDVTDRRNYAVSFEKIQRHLGFTSSTGMADGVREMLSKMQGQVDFQYRAEIYSNLAMTKRLAVAARGRDELMHLYSPLVVK